MHLDQDRHEAVINKRLKFANQVNENPDVCWAELVLWAFDPKNEFANCYNQGCRSVMDNYPIGYCGKCR